MDDKREVISFAVSAAPDKDTGWLRLPLEGSQINRDPTCNHQLPTRSLYYKFGFSAHFPDASSCWIHRESRIA